MPAPRGVQRYALLIRDHDRASTAVGACVEVTSTSSTENCPVRSGSTQAEKPKAPIPWSVTPWLSFVRISVPPGVTS